MPRSAELGDELFDVIPTDFHLEVRTNFANRLSPLIFSLLASWPIALVSSLLFSNGSGVTRFSHIIPSLAKLAAKHYPIGFMAQSGRELWTTELLKFCRSTLTSPYVS
jgi:hypothetical protein